MYVVLKFVFLYIGKCVLSSQSVNSEMIFKDKWLLNTGQFTIKMNNWNHKISSLKGRWLLYTVVTNTGLSVYGIFKRYEIPVKGVVI